MLRQLTSLDAQFLALESPRQAGHVAGLAILDPSTAPGGTVTLADLQHLLAERLPLLPPLRWRLAEVPLGLDYPYWVDDADFDLEYHVRELGLPARGRNAQLAGQVARIPSRPLDRPARCGSSTSSTACRAGTRRCSRRSTTPSWTGCRARRS